MPRLSTPAEMPSEMQATIDVLGSHVRSEILRVLSTQAMSAVAVADELEVAHSSVHRHLDRLEQHGLVEADSNVERGHRRGQKAVLWRTVPEQVDALGRRWITYATGEAD